MIGVIGVGVVGTKVVETLAGNLEPNIGVLDRSQVICQRVATRLGGETTKVSVISSPAEMDPRVAVLCGPTPHAQLAREFLTRGVNVVSTSDSIDDCVDLLTLSELAIANSAVLVVGAATAPGLSGLLVAHLATGFDEIDEAHVAMHGTGGPSCARQHHRGLAEKSIGWQDGQWLGSRGGSGRELCWFPGSVGAYDCYRGGLPDPILIKRAFPQLGRVSARVSATRRDRMFARLPMLIPPQAEGGLGGLRVAVRGVRGSHRVTEVAGVTGHVGQIAGVVAAVTAMSISRGEISGRGAKVLGSKTLPNVSLLNTINKNGIETHEFIGA